MKKILSASFLTLSVQLFAQEITAPVFPAEMTAVSNGLGLEIIAILIAVFFYMALPALLYCIGSYSLSLLNKYYNKKASSKISWIPFVRYYDFVKQATKSPKKAFIITLLPWILVFVGVLGVIVVGIKQAKIDIDSVAWITPAFTTFGILIALGIMGIIGMNFWRAFIIARHVKGDVTTALGLSTYTAIVLWYIALDRVRKNTNIIGILGFITIGLIVCFYIGIIFVLGFSGLATFLGV